MRLVISKQKLLEIISLESVKKVKLQETRELNVRRFFLEGLLDVVVNGNLV